MYTRGISQDQLGQLLGKSQAYVSRRLTATYAWNADELEIIAERLGLTVSDLVADGSAPDASRPLPTPPPPQPRPPSAPPAPSPVGPKPGGPKGPPNKPPGRAGAEDGEVAA